MLRQLSLTADELYLRRSVQALIKATAEEDEARRKSRCGRACADLDGFENALAERLTEAVR
jgi:hypothetical protein